jgi:hypothetical protein
VTENSDGSAQEQRGSAKKVRGRPFQPGQSGNPGGRPKDDIGEYIRETNPQGRKLVEFWLAVMENRAPGFEGKAEVRDAQRASECLAARGWGKERESLEVTGAEGERLTVVVQTLAEPKAGE